MLLLAIVISAKAGLQLGLWGFLGFTPTFVGVTKMGMRGSGPAHDAHKRHDRTSGVLLEDAAAADAVVAARTAAVLRPIIEFRTHHWLRVHAPARVHDRLQPVIRRSQMLRLLL